MSGLNETYETMIKDDKIPDYIICNMKVLSYVMLELYHEHIPVTKFMLDNRLSDNEVYFSTEKALQIIPEMAEYYGEYTILLPPTKEVWEENGYKMGARPGEDGP